MESTACDSLCGKTGNLPPNGGMLMAKGFEMSAVDKKSACRSCVFWLSLKQAWSGAYDDCDDGPLQYMGFCRRYPPRSIGEVEKVHLAITNEKGEDVGEREPVEYVKSEFPFTDDHEWCGEYKRLGD